MTANQQWMLGGRRASAPAPANGLAQLFSLNGNTLVLSNANRTATYSGAIGAWRCAGLADAAGDVTYTLSDKRYFEVLIEPSGPSYMGIAVGFQNNSIVSSTVNPFVAGCYMACTVDQSGGSLIGAITNGSLGASLLYACSLGSVLGVAVDGTTGKVYFSKNGTFISGQDPVTGTGPAFTLSTLASRAWITTHDHNDGAEEAFTMLLDTDEVLHLPAGYAAWNAI
jgi:hypothetical protein